MRRRSAPLYALCSVIGLAACSSSSTSTSNTVVSLPKLTNNTVFSTLPTTTTATTAAPPATEIGGAAVTTQPGQAADGSTTYTIKANDILVRIAKTYNCKYQDILTANSYTGDANTFLPAVGGTITLPPNCKLSAASTSTTTKAGATTTTKAGATTTTKAGSTTTKAGTATTVADGTTYTVVANDTLSGIAKKFGTTAQAIVTANGWKDGTGHHINPGDVIKLPAKAT